MKLESVDDLDQVAQGARRYIPVGITDIGLVGALLLFHAKVHETALNNGFVLGEFGVVFIPVPAGRVEICGGPVDIWGR